MRSTARESSLIRLRTPRITDGMAIHRLIKACPPLDVNSAYCYLLQSRNFPETSVVAEINGELVGFISGHLLPTRSDTLFIWQVAVSAEARGQKLGGRMIEHILSRADCAQVSFIETTVTESNKASWALFEGIATHYNTQLKRKIAFDKEDHFNAKHESEILARIGPLNPVETGANRLRASLTTA